MPEFGFLTRVTICAAALTLLIAAIVLGAHSVARRREAARERRVRDLAVTFAQFLTGGTDAEGLRRAAGQAPSDVFWLTLEGLADCIAGEEWTRLMREMRDLPAARRERRRLAGGPTWRRALAARHLGLLDDPELRAPLRRALLRGPATVRLSAALALARLSDQRALRWLLRDPGTGEALGRHLRMAILKRFGPAFAPKLRRALSSGRTTGAMAVAAAEVLGVWRDASARPQLEAMLRDGGLEERVAAARALGHLARHESVGSLCTALQDPAWQVRAQAARALGEIPVPEAVRFLEPLTGDPAWWVRRNACYALAAQGEEGFNALCRIAQLGHDRYAREMAIEVLQAQEWERRSPGGMDRVG